MKHEPLKNKRCGWKTEDSDFEYFDNASMLLYLDVRSAVKGLREEIDNLDIPVDQKFKIVGLFSKWFYDVIVGGK